MYIEKINGPQDVKKLSIDELNALASEMRDALLHRASVHGGHFGPNFGIVEATLKPSRASPPLIEPSPMSAITLPLPFVTSLPLASPQARLTEVDV